MPTIIDIPNSASIKAAKGFMTKVDWSLGPATLIRFHERWCHMQPWLLSAMAAWGLKAQDHGTDITVANGNRAAYAWRFGLADYLGIDPPVLVTPHEEAGRFVPLRTIKTPEQHGKLIGDVVPLLHLADEPQQARAVQYVLSEMIRNVREHSHADHGAVVCAQYYRGTSDGRRSYVSVGVADTGIGIHESLRHNYPEAIDDTTSVLLAIRPGVSGAQRTQYGYSNNAGAGLFYTRRLAQSSDQYFALASGAAMFRTSTAQSKPRDDQLLFPIAAYPGTVVCVNFALENEVDFDEFLAVTGKAFSQLDDALRSRVRDRVQFG